MKMMWGQRRTLKNENHPKMTRFKSTEEWSRQAYITPEDKGICILWNILYSIEFICF